jgi:hypothetical protein
MDLFYGNFNPDAKHKRFQITHEDYLANDVSLSIYCCVPGWCIELNYWDILHVDHLGNDRVDAASCIVEFLEGNLLEPGLPKEIQLRNFFVKCRLWCKSNKRSKPKTSFTLASVNRSQKNFPEMGRHFKGMELKTIMRFLSDECWAKHDGSQHSRARMTVMWANVQFHHVLVHADLYLTPHEIDEAQYAGRIGLIAFQWLANRSVEEDTKLWHLKPKRHYKEHIVEDLSNGLNPKRFTCDVDETFMHVLKRIGSKCHGGGSLMRRMMQRYLLGFALRLKLRAQSSTWQVLKRIW